MSDHVYRVVEVVGSSEESSDDAIRRAVEKVSTTVDHVGWFEVKETRGHVEGGKVMHFQVTLKVGFTISDTTSAG